jgi:TatA/E family protein of Tat protein translocase
MTLGIGTLVCLPRLLPIARGQYDELMNLGFPEMIFLFFFALILFGPKKLPEIGRQIGRALNEFKRASNEFRSQIESEISQLDLEPKQQILPPAQPPAGSMPVFAGSGLTPDVPGRVLTPESTDVEHKQEILPPVQPPPGSLPELAGSGLTADATGTVLTPELSGNQAAHQLTEGSAVPELAASEPNLASKAVDA